MKRHLFIYALLLTTCICNAQINYTKADSLLRLAAKSTADSTKARLFDKLADVYALNRNDSAEYFISQTRNYGQRAGLKNYEVLCAFRKATLENLKGNDSIAQILFTRLIPVFDSLAPDNLLEKGHTYFYLAWIANKHNNFFRSENLYLKAIECYKKIPNEKSLGSAYNNLGLSFHERQVYDESLKCFLQSLKYRQQSGDIRGQASTLGNIAMSYYSLKQFQKSIELHRESMNMAKESNAESAFFNAMNNIGIAYFDLGKTDSAEHYYRKVLHEMPSDKYPVLRARAMNNLGLIYEKRLNFPLALEYFNQSLLLKEKIEDLDGVAGVYSNIGYIRYKQGNTKEAERDFLKAYDIAKEIGVLDRQQEAATGLYEVYYNSGRYKEAADWFKTASELKDSIYNEKNSRTIAEMAEQFETERKEQENLLLRHQAEKTQLEIEKGNTQRFYLIILSSFAIFVAGTAFYAFNSKRKSNQLLSRQKAQIELQNKEITDSINYARKIQESILPDREELLSVFPESFIIYLPKDIVAGDFYWIKKIQRGDNPLERFSGSPAQQKRYDKLLVAAADCTGHGVPGAFMSLIGKENLDKASHLSSSPAEILFHLNRFVKNSLRQNDEKDAMRDGMDIALCSIEKNEGKTTVKFSGANRPLWHFSAEDKQLKEYKATKCAIGGLTNSDQEFPEYATDVRAGDSVYIFSDGYADQFGGEKQKKFTTRQLKQLLTEIGDQPADQQQAQLRKTLESWKGATEQIDDILFIGIKF